MRRVFRSRATKLAVGFVAVVALLTPAALIYRTYDAPEAAASGHECLETATSVGVSLIGPPSWRTLARAVVGVARIDDACRSGTRIICPAGWGMHVIDGQLWCLADWRYITQPIVVDLDSATVHHNGLVADVQTGRFYSLWTGEPIAWLDSKFLTKLILYLSGSNPVVTTTTTTTTTTTAPPPPACNPDCCC